MSFGVFLDATVQGHDQRILSIATSAQALRLPKVSIEALCFWHLVSGTVVRQSTT